MEGTERLTAPVFLKFRERAEQVLRQRERAVYQRAGQKRPVLVAQLFHHADAGREIVGIEHVNMNVVDRIFIIHRFPSVGILTFVL